MIFCMPKPHTLIITHELSTASMLRNQVRARLLPISHGTSQAFAPFFYISKQTKTRQGTKRKLRPFIIPLFELRFIQCAHDSRSGMLFLAMIHTCHYTELGKAHVAPARRLAFNQVPRRAQAARRHARARQLQRGKDPAVKAQARRHARYAIWFHLQDMRYFDELVPFP